MLGVACWGFKNRIHPSIHPGALSFCFSRKGGATARSAPLTSNSSFDCHSPPGLGKQSLHHVLRQFVAKLKRYRTRHVSRLCDCSAGSTFTHALLLFASPSRSDSSLAACFSARPWDYFRRSLPQRIRSVFCSVNEPLNSAPTRICSESILRA